GRDSERSRGPQMGARLSAGQLSLEVEINETTDKLLARSLGNGVVGCTSGGRRSCLCRFHPNVTTSTFHRALSISSEYRIARGDSLLGPNTDPSGGCGAAGGGCAHLEAQADCARGGRGTFRRLANAVRGQSQPARIRHSAEPFRRLPKIAFRDDMAQRGFRDHGFDLPRTMARPADTRASLAVACGLGRSLPSEGRE